MTYFVPTHITSSYSVRRLRNMLSCFDASVSMAIGERYGYSMNAPYGYEYPTGGSGSVNTSLFTLYSPYHFLYAIVVTRVS